MPFRNREETPTITFRRIQRSDVIEAAVRRRLDRLKVYCPSIMAARVIVEPAERHRRDGNRFRVRLDLKVPGDEIVISHEAGVRQRVRAAAAEKMRKQDEHDRSRRYLNVAIREVFEQARRRLQDYTRLRRGAVKRHEPPPEARVIRLFPLRGYGFLEAPDGHELYFQRTAVLNDAFGELRVGSRVAFVEERGNKGPQASTVRLLAARRPAARRTAVRVA